MATDLETLTRNYWTAVQRIRRMPVPAADKAIVLADATVIYGGRGRGNLAHFWRSHLQKRALRTATSNRPIP